MLPGLPAFGAYIAFFPVVASGTVAARRCVSEASFTHIAVFAFPFCATFVACRTSPIEIAKTLAGSKRSRMAHTVLTTETRFAVWPPFVRSTIAWTETVWVLPCDVRAQNGKTCGGQQWQTGRDHFRRGPAWFSGALLVQYVRAHITQPAGGREASKRDPSHARYPSARCFGRRIARFVHCGCTTKDQGHACPKKDNVYNFVDCSYMHVSR